MLKQTGRTENQVAYRVLELSEIRVWLRLEFVARLLVLLAVLGFCSVAVGQEKTDQQQTVKTVAGADETAEAVKFDFSDGKPPETLEQLKEMQEHFVDLSERAKAATVNVRVGQAQGSGVIVTRDGYVLTAAHVVGEANRPAVIQLPDGTELRAKTLGLNRFVDSGLIKIVEDGKYPYLDLGESEPLKLGQWVMAIGHPDGWNEERGLVVRVGRIVSKRPSLIGTDCTLVGGDSGGPLIDMDGAVIGIHSRIGGSLDENWHVPVDTYLDTWDRLVKGEDWGSGVGGIRRPYIGIRFKPNSLEVDTVFPRGPGERVGLQTGDVFLEFDGVELDSLRRMEFAMARVRVGQVVKVRYKRGDEENEVELTVGLQRR